MPDGSHVILEFYSQPYPERSGFRWFSLKRTPVRESLPIPASDGVYTCQIAIVSAEGVAPVLNARLKGFPYNSTHPEEWPERYPGVWIIGFGDEKSPSQTATSLAMAESTGVPLREEGKTMNNLTTVDLLSGSTQVKSLVIDSNEGYWKNSYDYHWRMQGQFNLVGEKLVKLGDKKEPDKDYREMVVNANEKLQLTLKQAGI